MMTAVQKPLYWGSLSSFFLMGSSTMLDEDKSLHIVPPLDHREQLFREALEGIHVTHLRENKIHSQLGSHYWWPK